MADKKRVEVVQSLAKWKESALAKYGEELPVTVYRYRMQTVEEMRSLITYSI